MTPQQDAAPEDSQRPQPDGTDGVERLKQVLDRETKRRGWHRRLRQADPTTTPADPPGSQRKGRSRG